MSSRSFVDTLREVRGGASIAELTEQLQQLVAAVQEAGRPGKLTYTLVVKPASRGDVTTLMLEDAIKVAAPSLARSATIFYATSDHALTRNDPRQPELPNLRVADYRPPTAKDTTANG